MNENTQKAKDLMLAGDATCVLCKEDSPVITSTDRGIKPLMGFLAGGTDLGGYSAADRVVGKAAAFLYVLLGVREVYAPVMSEPAARVLKENGIEAYRDVQPEAIRNRTDTGICPMESAVWEIDDPREALSAIRKKLSELS
ncbi:MAG: DUF1893 domain-containing protein [Eubacteriales bacterium]